MEAEDNRTGSADSENGSSDSYVHVPQEEVQGGDPMCETDPENANQDEEDIYTFSGEQEDIKPSMEEGDEATPETVQEKVSRISSIEDVPKPEKPIELVKQPTIATGLLSFLNVLHPAVLYVVFWKEPKLSAVVLGGILVTLLTLTLNTFIHTVVLFLLSFLVVSLTYIVVKIALDSFYNRPIKNPFSDYLSKKIALPEDKVVEWTVYFVNELNCVFNALARRMMFDNIKQTFKFGITLWILSFVTNCFTLMRALFFGITLLFTIPPIYARNQKRIDDAVNLVVNSIMANLRRVLSRVPFMKEKLQ